MWKWVIDKQTYQCISNYSTPTAVFFSNCWWKRDDTIMHKQKNCNQWTKTGHNYTGAWQGLENVHLGIPNPDLLKCCRVLSDPDQRPTAKTGNADSWEIKGKIMALLYYIEHLLLFAGMIVPHVPLGHRFADLVLHILVFSLLPTIPSQIINSLSWAPEALH